MFLAFYGEARRERDAARESPRLMKVPMYVLAEAIVFAGWFGWVFRSLARCDWSAWPLMVASAVIAACGIWLAWRYYMLVPGRRLALDRRFNPIVQFLRNRWYIDALYEEHLLNGLILHRPHRAPLAPTNASLTGRWMPRLGWLAGSRVCFAGSTDGLSMASYGPVPALSGSFLAPIRAMQTGFLQTYLFLFVAGILAALGYYLTR